MLSSRENRLEYQVTGLRAQVVDLQRAMARTRRNEKKNKARLACARRQNAMLRRSLRIAMQKARAAVKSLSEAVGGAETMLASMQAAREDNEVLRAEVTLLEAFGRLCAGRF
jgi:hypothetical protein